MKYSRTSPNVLSIPSVIGISFTVLAFMLSASVAFAGSYDDAYNFSASAQLNGQNEVPAVTSTTTGSFELKNDSSYLLNVYNGKDITAAHLHCAQPGQNGPVIVNLYQMDMPSVDGPLAAGTITDAHIYPEGKGCSTPIANVADLRQAIMDGIIYVNVHTKKNPNGEVRGQLSGAFSGGYVHDKDDKHDGYDKKDHKDGYNKDNKHYGGGSSQATAVSYSSAQAYGGSSQASATSYAAAQGSSAYSASYSAASAQSSQKKSYNDYNDYGHDDKKDHDYGNKDDSKQDNRYGHYDKKDDKSFSKHSYSGTNHNSYAANIRADVNDMLDAKLKVGLNF